MFHLSRGTSLFLLVARCESVPRVRPSHACQTPPLRRSRHYAGARHRSWVCHTGSSGSHAPLWIGQSGQCKSVLPRAGWSCLAIQVCPLCPGRLSGLRVACASLVRCMVGCESVPLVPGTATSQVPRYYAGATLLRRCQTPELRARLALRELPQLGGSVGPVQVCPARPEFNWFCAAIHSLADCRACIPAPFIE